jgi:hypothetical protein
MYGQVEIHTGGARRLMVPESAVLDSGDRQVVYVDRGTAIWSRARCASENTGRPGGNPGRPEGGRAHRHLRQLPAGFGEPVESGGGGTAK